MELREQRQRRLAQHAKKASESPSTMGMGHDDPTVSNPQKPNGEPVPELGDALVPPDIKKELKKESTMTYADFRKKLRADLGMAPVAPKAEEAPPPFEMKESEDEEPKEDVKADDGEDHSAVDALPEEEPMADPDNMMEPPMAADDMESALDDVKAMDEELKSLLEDTKEEPQALPEEDKVPPASYASYRKRLRQAMESMTPMAPAALGTDEMPALQSEPEMPPPMEEEKKSEDEEPKMEEVPQAMGDNMVPMMSEEEMEQAKLSSVHLQLFNASSDNPHYVIHFNGHPVASVALKDQDSPEEVAAYFTTDEYAKHVAAAIDKLGPREVLPSIHAKLYVAKVNSSKISKDIEARVRAEQEKDYKIKLSQTKENLNNIIALVLEASHKNYLLDNPLKDSLFEEMKSAGVYNPVPVIEAAFAKGGRKFFEAVLKKAEEWSEMHPEALADITSEVLRMKPTMPTVDTAANEAIHQAATASVPLRTYQPVDSEKDSLKDRFRSTLKLGGKR